MSGSNSAGQTGLYGTPGVASSSNVPGARFLAVSWIDSSDQLWLFGGVDSNGAPLHAWRRFCASAFVALCNTHLLYARMDLF